MKSQSRLMKTFIATTLALGLGLVAQSAEAGRGASYSSIDSAIRSGGTNAIISEIERAERLVCGPCIERVMTLLDHDDYRVRQVAAWWFAKRPAQMREITERSLAELQIGSARQVRNAADALGTFERPAAVPALATAFARTDLDVEARVAIARALGNIGHQSANPTLEQAMADSSAEVRLAAVTAWQGILGQSRASAAIPLLSDSALEVRRQASALMGVYSQADARVALEARLSDPDPGVRRNAAWALGRIGDAASRPALLAAAEDESGLVRRVARASLNLLR